MTPTASTSEPTRQAVDSAASAEVTPTVSVVTPCFNAAPWIRACLDSALANAEILLEIIVVDDGSTDDSARIVRDEYPTVRLICTENRGASQARNLALSVATGRYVQFLDADETLPPGKIAAQLKLLEQGEAEVAYCDWRHLTLESDGSWTAGPLVARRLSAEPELDLCGEHWWPPHAYLFRRCFLEEHRIRFLPELWVLQDVRFTQDCAYAGARFVFSSGPLVHYRIHSMSQNSRKNRQLFLENVLRNALGIEDRWRRQGSLNGVREELVLAMYGGLARASFTAYPRLFEQACLRFERLRPDFVPKGPRLFKLLARLLGYRRAERLAWHYRRGKKLLGWRPPGL